LGQEVHWFHDLTWPDPKDFDYGNSIFFVDNQGRTDRNVPIVESSIYFSYDVFKYVAKYLGRVRGLINYRVAEYRQPVPDGKRYIEVEKGIVFDNDSPDPFDVVHLHYGTNLLPHEIDLEWAKKKRDNEYNFVGTIHAPRPGAPPIHQDFIEIVKKNNIFFTHRDPWVNPASESENINLMQGSIFVPDFRPAEQKDMRYTADRIMKAISYGCLSVADVDYAREFIVKDLLVGETAQEIFDLGMENQYNTELVTHLMEVVRRDHTWVTRCKGLLSIAEEF